MNSVRRHRRQRLIVRASQARSSAAWRRCPMTHAQEIWCSNRPPESCESHRSHRTSFGKRTAIAVVQLWLCHGCALGEVQFPMSSRHPVRRGCTKSFGKRRSSPRARNHCRKPGCSVEFHEAPRKTCAEPTFSILAGVAERSDQPDPACRLRDHGRPARRVTPRDRGLDVRRRSGRGPAIAMIGAASR